MVVTGDVLNYLQVFALVLSGWAVVIQITLRRMEKIGFFTITERHRRRRIWHAFDRVRGSADISSLLYSISVLWIVLLSGALFYRSTVEIRYAISQTSTGPVYNSINLALDGLILLIGIVTLTFVYSSLSSLTRDEAMSLISIIILLDTGIYILSTGIDGVFNPILTTSLPTLSGLIFTPIIHSCYEASLVSFAICSFYLSTLLGCCIAIFAMLIIIDNWTL